ncbi:MAG: hypothetical protein GY931_11980 [Maribacter sp.]|nr:hypothetical protein [Maribacter sp.]
MQETKENEIADDDYQMVMVMIKSFLQWLKTTSLKSFDWHDIWGMSIGSSAKIFYAKNKILGMFAVSPLLFLDLVYPNCRKFFVRKRSFSICHAHVGMAYLNLFKITEQQEYLQLAESLVEQLLNMTSTQAHGLGWGININWTTTGGLIPTNTPCNTQTAYVYEFFSQLHEITGNQLYLEYLKKISYHVAYDFPEWRIGDSLACSYSMVDMKRTAVVNANSYRALMLVDAGERFNNREYMEKGISTLRFVLSMQNKDGSWPYSEDQNFVDHYHTCFVIKNLFKLKKILSNNAAELDNTIQRGLSYYFSNLFDSNGYPIPFAVKANPTFHKYDSYDVAESIGLLAELDIEYKKIIRLCHFAKARFQTKDGWFIFRYYALPFLKGIPYIRYANSAMFLALTRVLLGDMKRHDSTN